MAEAKQAGDPDPSISVLGAAVRIASENAMQAALQKVGLHLEPRKGSVETIVVDHLEKTPTEN